MLTNPKELLRQKKQGLQLSRLTYVVMGLNIGTIASQSSDIPTLGKIAIAASALTMIASMYKANDLKFDIDELEEHIKEEDKKAKER